MPVLRMCARHRTLSEGRRPQCVSDRYERRRLHVSAEGKRFRAAILEREGPVPLLVGPGGHSLPLTLLPGLDGRAVPTAA